MTFTIDRSNWTRVRFGDVVRKSKEKVNPTLGEVEYYVAGEHMETDNLHIDNKGIIGDGYLGPAFHMRFHPGQVLYGSRRTYLRKVAYADFDGVCANTTFVLETADDSKLAGRFLPFVMQAEPFHEHAIAVSKGSTNPYVNWPDIAAYEFLLPPIEEQHRIADLLWQFERHRIELDQLAKESSTTIQGISDMSLTSCPLGDLSSLCKLEASLLSPDTEGFMTLPHVGIDRIDPLTGAIEITHTAGEDHVKSGKFYFREGDVLYAKIRPNLRKVGIAYRDGLCSADCYPLTPSAGISPELLRVVLLSKSVYEQAVALSARTAMPKLNRKQLFSIPVPVPDEATSEKIYSLISIQRVLVSKIDEELLKAEQMKRSLLAEVFGGSDVC